MIDLQTLINDFFKFIKKNDIEIYNEFSMQHELGIFLRGNLPNYKVQFERNVSYFNIDKSTIKKEIDIVVFSEDKKEKYAIELKCPFNGQYPEQLYSFVKDIKFMEQLKELGFDRTFCVSIVSSRPFYQGNDNYGVYKFFREEFSVYGNIYKPTGEDKNKKSILLNGSYNFTWQDLDEQKKYYIITI